MIDAQQKFVFAGNMGAGKTTAIAAISGGDTLRMEVPLPEHEHQGDKTTTTVGFDFGIVSLGGTPLYLYGTPGQEHFHIVAGEIMTGAVGVVLLINAATRRIEADLDAWIEVIHGAAARVPVVIAVNRPEPQTPSIQDLRRQCRARSSAIVAVQIADPRRRIDMMSCLRVLTLAHLRG